MSRFGGESMDKGQSDPLGPSLHAAIEPSVISASVITFTPVNQAQSYYPSSDVSFTPYTTIGKRGQGQSTYPPSPPTTVKRIKRSRCLSEATGSAQDSEGGSISTHMLVSKPGEKVHRSSLHKASQMPTYERKRPNNLETSKQNIIQISELSRAKLAGFRYNSGSAKNFNAHEKLPTSTDSTATNDNIAIEPEYISSTIIKEPFSALEEEEGEPCNLHQPISNQFSTSLLWCLSGNASDLNQIAGVLTTQGNEPQGTASPLHFETQHDQIDNGSSFCEPATAGSCTEEIDADLDDSVFDELVLREVKAVEKLMVSKFEQMNANSVEPPDRRRSYSPELGLSLSEQPSVASETQESILKKHSGGQVNGLDEFDDDIIDMDQVLELVDRVSKADHCSLPSTPRPSTPKLQWNASKDYDSRQKSLSQSLILSASRAQGKGSFEHKFPSSTSQLCSSPTSQSIFSSSPTSRIFDLPPLFPSPFPPFVRSAFPAPVQDRSPVPGLSPRSPLTTHFRLGAALNYAAAISRNFSISDALIELYSRVLVSERDGPRQTFRFADSFRPEQPPYLEGVWVGWKGVPYWEADGAVFLGEEGRGRLCRVIGRIERGLRRNWRMCVLSIWEASWDDLEVVKGIVCT